MASSQVTSVMHKQRRRQYSEWQHINIERFEANVDTSCSSSSPSNNCRCAGKQLRSLNICKIITHFIHILHLSLLMFRCGFWDQSVKIPATFPWSQQGLFFRLVFKFKKGNLEMSADNVEAAIVFLFRAKKNNTLLFSMWTTLPACQCLVCKQRCVVISYQYKEITSLFFKGSVS